jgi:competence protein ComEC
MPEFLTTVRPRIAIISCGRHNVFGHPSPGTLDALRTEGATTYRTDRDGGISIDTNGETIYAKASAATD